MGTFSLICHPKTPALGVRSVAVDWASQGDRLVLTYRVAGAGRLILPAQASPERADGLWKATCFELFLGLEGKAYREFNFSPSGRWASSTRPSTSTSAHAATSRMPPLMGIPQLR